MSRCWQDGNGYGMCKNENRSCKASKTTVFRCWICKCRHCRPGSLFSYFVIIVWKSSTNLKPVLKRVNNFYVLAFGIRSIRKMGRLNGTDLSFGDIMGNVVDCFLFLWLSVVPKSRFKFLFLPTLRDVRPSAFFFPVIKMILFGRLERLLLYYILICAYRTPKVKYEGV